MREPRLANIKYVKSDQNVLVARLKSQENQYGAQLVADKASIAASQVAISKIRSAAPSLKKSTISLGNSTPSLVASRGGATFTSNTLIAYASNYLGLPYIWGGTTPAGFDCSGYTQYVFAHFGISLPRVSQDQQNVGTLISRANLQPGDLVFFGTPAHHVGIYIGNGNMISSPHTGDVIKIQTLNGDFTYGRRVY